MGHLGLFFIINKTAISIIIFLKNIFNSLYIFYIHDFSNNGSSSVL